MLWQSAKARTEIARRRRRDRDEESGSKRHLSFCSYIPHTRAAVFAFYEFRFQHPPLHLTVVTNGGLATMAKCIVYRCL